MIRSISSSCMEKIKLNRKYVADTSNDAKKKIGTELTDGKRRGRRCGAPPSSARRRRPAARHGEANGGDGVLERVRERWLEATVVTAASDALGSTSPSSIGCTEKSREDITRCARSRGRD